ncbi:MAG: hypothetical protein RIT19_213 [Verrucomicrobiota bacterium]
MSGCARCHDAGWLTGHGKGGLFCWRCALVLAARVPWKVAR